MKVVEINMTANGSTGSIMFNISKLLQTKGEEVKTFSATRWSKTQKNQKLSVENHEVFGNEFESFLHTLLGQFTGLNGAFSYFGTMALIKKIKRFSPDIIHLHNLHAFCINLPLLFRYIKKNNIPVVWTLHDCWTFTGHCPHFVMVNCDRWKSECHHCPQLSTYPKSRVENTKMAHRLKKKWFLGLRRSSQLPFHRKGH